MKKQDLNSLIQKGVFDSSSTYLTKYNFANLFNVVNKGEKSYFNLSKTIHFINNDSLNSQLYNLYQIVQNDTWTNISYKFYKTIELWWLICKFNNIKNPITQLQAGKVIKIPSQDIVDNILEVIKNN